MLQQYVLGIMMQTKQIILFFTLIFFHFSTHGSIQKYEKKDKGCWHGLRSFLADRAECLKNHEKRLRDDVEASRRNSSHDCPHSDQCWPCGMFFGCCCASGVVSNAMWLGVLLQSFLGHIPQKGEPLEQLCTEYLKKFS